MCEKEVSCFGGIEEPADQTKRPAMGNWSQNLTLTKKMVPGDVP